MKENIKLLATVIGGIIGASVPLYGAYSFWAWIMSQVPAANEWAGLIKVGITIGLIPIGGGITCLFAFLAGMGLACIVAMLTGLLD